MKKLDLLSVNIAIYGIYIIATLLGALVYSHSMPINSWLELTML